MDYYSKKLKSKNLKVNEENLINENYEDINDINNEPKDVQDIQINDNKEEKKPIDE